MAEDKNMNTIFTVYDVLDMFIEENKINLVKLFVINNDNSIDCLFTGTLTECLEFSELNHYSSIPYLCFGIQKYNNNEPQFLRIDIDSSYL